MLVGKNPSARIKAAQSSVELRRGRAPDRSASRGSTESIDFKAGLGCRRKDDGFGWTGLSAKSVDFRWFDERVRRKTTILGGTNEGVIYGIFRFAFVVGRQRFRVEVDAGVV